MATSGRIVATPSGDVAIHTAGTGAPVVLLHANPGSSRDYDAVVGPLSTGHRVIAVDWPGYGDSVAPDLQSFTGALSYAQTLVELLDALASEEFDRFVLVGNSVGGYAAVRAAAARPDRVAGLILIAPGGFTAMNTLTRGACHLMGDGKVGGSLAGPLARL